MSIVIAGKRIDTSKWFESCCWLDDPKRAPRISDFTPRKRWCRTIVSHTTKGRLGPLRKGSKPSQRAEALARYQIKTDRFVSWDWMDDTDGTVIWQNDPLEWYSWNATQWNSTCLGGELVQDEDGSVYEEQIRVYVLLTDLTTLALTHFGHSIQRQIPMKNGKVLPGVLPRADEHGSMQGADLCGIFAHHHNTEERGEGDCGPYAFEALAAAGYEQFDVNDLQDLKTWKARQLALGLTGKDVDGLPGRKTVAKIKATKNPHGLWITRPLDDEMMRAIAA